MAHLTLAVTRWEVSNCALNKRMTRIASQSNVFPLLIDLTRPLLQFCTPCPYFSSVPPLPSLSAIVVIQLLSCVPLFATPWTAAGQAPLFSTISCSLLKFMSIESVMPSNHLIICHPLLLLPSIFPTIRVLSIELALQIRWPKYWNFSFSSSPFNEYSRLISFQIDWFDFLAVQD